MTTEHTAFICQNTRQFGWAALYEFWEQPPLERALDKATDEAVPNATTALMQVLEIELRRQANATR